MCIKYFYTFFGYPMPHPFGLPIIVDPNTGYDFEGFVYELSSMNLPEILADNVREAPVGERFGPELAPRSDPMVVPGSDPISGFTDLMVTGKVESILETTEIG